MTESDGEMEVVEAPSARTFISNDLYDKLKFVALVLLPAFGTLYFTIAAITGLPWGEQVVGIVLAVDTFLGILLGISAGKYKANDDRFDGAIHISPNEDGNSDLNVSLDPEALATKDEITVKVHKK